MVERSKILSSVEKWLELKIVMGNKTQKDKITFLLLYAESRLLKKKKKLWKQKATIWE